MVISESALSDSRDLWRDLRVVPGHFRAKASVTAHDFVFSFRRVADPRTAAQYATILYPIKNIKS